ncbi:MAG: Sulfur acceptor protein CsdE [Candidatus Erwinia impunctatus]|nr:Sulfur acceptor protein CsdE [Culicoides impunctatus]
MTTTPFTPHPFGTQITLADLRTQFDGTTQWEERYRQLILLGKQLPRLPDHLKLPAVELQGCENRVWFGYQRHDDGTFHFYGDSEGRIVRGLLAILLTCAEGKTATELLEKDLLATFEQLGLASVLSASRSAGLTALCEAVYKAAKST